MSFDYPRQLRKEVLPYAADSWTELAQHTILSDVIRNNE